MRYESTRGQSGEVRFGDVLLRGLAPDGGLYQPETWPRLSPSDIRSLRGRSYEDVAFTVIRLFAEETFTDNELREIVGRSYACFSQLSRAPLRQLAHDHWVLELFHGPTLSFKDYALQFVGNALDHVLRKAGRTATLIGATSGDTGPAGIHAVRDRDRMQILMLHPLGKTSDFQRRQMTTVDAPNVHNLAVEGSFDDCQDIVKQLFADEKLRSDFSFSAVNSINWGRIVGQIVYYFWAAVSLGAPDRTLAFCVPTGNFGNVYAAHAARHMGLPIQRIFTGSNKNDALQQLLTTGTMRHFPTAVSIAPSMDVQVPSNFERLLFDVTGFEGSTVMRYMNSMKQSGQYTLAPEEHIALGQAIVGRTFSDPDIAGAIQRAFSRFRYVADPHSAIAIELGAEARKQLETGVVVVSVATAHPAKFASTVAVELGAEPRLPDHAQAVMTMAERYKVVSADFGAVRDYIFREMS